MKTISCTIIDEGLTSAIDVVNRFLQTPDSGIDLIEPFTPFEVDADRSTAAGTNDIRIVLKPSKRLLELMAAARAAQIDLGIVKES
jgi:hypothetical protein